MNFADVFVLCNFKILGSFTSASTLHLCSNIVHLVGQHDCQKLFSLERAIRQGRPSQDLVSRHAPMKHTSFTFKLDNPQYYTPAIGCRWACLQ